jgi:hypothetical protein
MFEFKPVPAWQIKLFTARQLVQDIIDTPSLSPATRLSPLLIECLRVGADLCKPFGALGVSLQIGLAGRDGVLVPFKTNARHVGNVKESVTDFIGPL